MILSAIDRAYRDFNRTMYGIAENRKKKINGYIELRSLMNEIVSEILNKDFKQLSFDNWHKDSCDRLINGFKKSMDYDINYGQAQKWINMSLKYMFAIGNEKIKGINRNYKYFHIPIDNIIQDKLEQVYIDRIPAKWSRVNDYTTYMDYQEKVRLAFEGQIPLDVEFRFFNGVI